MILATGSMILDTHLLKELIISLSKWGLDQRAATLLGDGAQHLRPGVPVILPWVKGPC